jgi:hypothetical protein
MSALLPGEGMLLAAASVGVLGILGYFLWPAVRAYRDFRGVRVIRCPETEAPAAVELDPLEAAATVGMGRRAGLRVTTCSRWPERRDCDQACRAEIEAAPMACLVQTILARWYEGKSCTLCGRPLGATRTFDRRPALLAPAGQTLEWDDLRAERVPETLATHRAVCWSCHIAEEFRRSHPELVTDRPATRA